MENQPIMSSNSNRIHKKVKVAIAGVGNCASALLQGILFYGNNNIDDKAKGNYQNTPEGLIAYNLGDIRPSDIEFVAAFDVVESKVTTCWRLRGSSSVVSPRSCPVAGHSSASAHL